MCLRDIPVVVCLTLMSARGEMRMAACPLLSVADVAVLSSMSLVYRSIRRIGELHMKNSNQKDYTLLD